MEGGGPATRSQAAARPVTVNRMSDTPILSPRQAAAWDAQAEARGIALATLMESAGRSVAAVLGTHLGGRLGGGVVIAVGPGNNGGDGWVLARALHRLEVPVWVAALPGKASPLNRQMADLARAVGVRSVAVDGPWPAAAVAVDAVLGTGARGAPRPPAQQLLDRIHQLAIPLVAIDGPSGVDLETGAVHGQARADLSVTFGGLRRGHALAREQVGDVVVVDIGHLDPDPAWPAVMTDALAAAWLPAFTARAHKGTRGRVVIVGGAPGMSGAVRLAGRAAFAAGAGLVHAVAPQATIDALVQAEPDLQTLVHDFGAPAPTPAPGGGLERLVDRADAVVVGPGLGRAAGRAELVLWLMERARASVVDADALVALVGRHDDIRRVSRGRRLILTPHPGEFRTLFPEFAETMELDPWLAAASASQAVGAVVNLKGVPSVVATPDGAAYTIVTGNPGLATGGSGDVLSGLIAALVAQGLMPFPATALGAHALGRAADLGARRRGGTRGLRPMDVIASLPALWRSWGRRSRPAPAPPVVLELPRPQLV